MNDRVQTTATKAKTMLFAGADPAFLEYWKLAIPDFGISRMDAPAALHDLAEKNASQGREAIKKIKSAAEETTTVLVATYSTVTRGASDCGLKIIEATRVNSNAALDFYSALMAVKSFSELIELSTVYAREQFEAVTAQTKELVALAQRVTTETSEPIKETVTNAYKKAA